MYKQHIFSHLPTNLHVTYIHLRSSGIYKIYKHKEKILQAFREHRDN